MTIPPTEPAPPPGRPLLGYIQMPARVRLFQTNDPLACRTYPEVFFDQRTMRRASELCASCPFLGRCGYNAVAVRATHGVWGGIPFPGRYSARLAPIYARLADQFERRRSVELGPNFPVAPLPDFRDFTQRRRAAPADAA